MEFFENTTTPLDLILSVDTEGIGYTNRGFMRFPEGHEDYAESECDVCNATADIALRDKDTNEGLCEECATEYLEGLKDERVRNNPYTSYSLDTLEFLSSDYIKLLGNGHKTLANGENLAEAYELVLSAIERRQKTDFCKHGRFIHQEGLCHYCEME
jgi:hypothetical protein